MRKKEREEKWSKKNSRVKEILKQKINIGRKNQNRQRLDCFVNFFICIFERKKRLNEIVIILISVPVGNEEVSYVPWAVQLTVQDAQQKDLACTTLSMLFSSYP